MDLKEEAHRRIAEMTRSAYERGFQDGVQSTLAEIDEFAAAGQSGDVPVDGQPLIEETAPADKETPKTTTVERCLAQLLASQREARREDILAAARTVNPKITSQDVSNAIRRLLKHRAISVDSDDKSRVLPAE